MEKIVYLFVATAFMLSGCRKGPEEPPTPEPVKVESVVITPRLRTIEVGEEFGLNATIMPDTAENKAVSWSSSAPEIASVSTNGVVTGKAEGSATITATTLDGGKTAVCAITVIPKIVPPPIPNILEDIPDAAFRAYCEGQMGTWDTNGDGKLSPVEASKVDRISIRALSMKVVSLEGIEHFTGLTFLECHSSELIEADVSANTALTTLILYNGKLTSLDVSQNTALEGLGCDTNPLVELDLSKNTALGWLRCSDNGLTSLDVSNNTALTQLTCPGNQLTQLDVSANTALEFLVCFNNRIASLDLSKNTSLGYLTCYSNRLASLDLRGNTSLVSLTCWGNPGDGVSWFPITAWFDNSGIPANFSSSSWQFDGTTITPYYRK